MTEDFNDLEELEYNHRAPIGIVIALKDFEINHGDFHLVIKKGDDLSGVPEIYKENLKTEGII